MQDLIHQQYPHGSRRPKHRPPLLPCKLRGPHLSQKPKCRTATSDIPTCALRGALNKASALQIHKESTTLHLSSQIYMKAGLRHGLPMSSWPTSSAHSAEYGPVKLSGWLRPRSLGTAPAHRQSSKARYPGLSLSLSLSLSVYVCTYVKTYLCHDYSPTVNEWGQYLVIVAERLQLMGLGFRGAPSRYEMPTLGA